MKKKYLLSLAKQHKSVNYYTNFYKQLNIYFKMPADLPNMTGSEVSVFVERTLKQIKEGVTNAGADITEPVQFELEVTEKQEVEGGAGVSVWKSFIKIGGKKENESVQKIKFSALP
ncbi:MAG: trypco2 family protein [Clostridia bacterium]